MATSKNRRKNGKAVKHNRSKRMHNLLSADLKNLLVCSVVDKTEIDGDRKLSPRTLVYSTKLKKPIVITTLQEAAIKADRWRWEVQCGVICRNPNGEVYIDKEVNFLSKEPYLLTELNELIADTLLDSFEQANHLHRLTMFWVAAPVEQEKFTLDAVLCPVWKYNVLGNMLTQWEQDNEDHIVVHYRSDTFEEFVNWFEHQGKYRVELKEVRTVTLWWEATGTKMQKGELVKYRKELIEVGRIEQLGFEKIKFNPLATVKGFTGLGKLTFVDTGLAFSQLMAALDQVPPCLNCIVEVRYKDGRENTIKFHYGDSV